MTTLKLVLAAGILGLVARSHVQAQPLAPICRAQQASAANASRDSAGIQIVESWSPIWRDANAALRLAPQPRTTIGEGRTSGAAYQFGRLASVTRLNDGRVVVGDGQAVEVRAFDAAGTFIGAIGRKGQGPGEFNYVNGVLKVAGDTLVVVEPARVSFFAPSGVFVRNVRRAAPTPPGSTVAAIVGRHGDGSWLITLPTQRQGERRTYLRRLTSLVGRVDPAYTQIDSVVPLFGSELLTYVYGDNLEAHAVPWSHAGSVARSERGFVETAGDSYEVRERTPDGRVVRIVRLCRQPAQFTAAEVATLRNTFADRETDADAHARAFLMLDLMPRARYKPAFVQLMTDAAGRLWAREYAMPGSVESWQVFDATGKHLGLVLIPPRHTIREIGRDYIITHFAGADDVLSVRVYALLGA